MIESLRIQFIFIVDEKEKVDGRPVSRRVFGKIKPRMDFLFRKTSKKAENVGLRVSKFLFSKLSRVRS